MATAENQNLYDIYMAANVQFIELEYPSEVQRHSDQTPLDSKIICTLRELAEFAERVRDEAKAEYGITPKAKEEPRGTFVSVPDLYEIVTRADADRDAEVLFTMGDVQDLIEHARTVNRGRVDVTASNLFRV